MRPIREGKLQEHVNRLTEAQVAATTVETMNPQDADIPSGVFLGLLPSVQVLVLNLLRAEHLSLDDGDAVPVQLRKGVVRGNNFGWDLLREVLFRKVCKAPHSRLSIIWLTSTQESSLHLRQLLEVAKRDRVNGVMGVDAACVEVLREDGRPRNDMVTDLPEVMPLQLVIWRKSDPFPVSHAMQQKAMMPAEISVIRVLNHHLDCCDVQRAKESRHFST